MNRKIILQGIEFCSPTFTFKFLFFWALCFVKLPLHSVRLFSSDFYHARIVFLSALPLQAFKLRFISFYFFRPPFFKLCTLWDYLCALWDCLKCSALLRLFFQALYFSQVFARPLHFSKFYVLNKNCCKPSRPLEHNLQKLMSFQI